MRKDVLRKAGPVFVCKQSVFLKKLCESRYGMRLVVKAEQLPEPKMSNLIAEGTELCNILVRSSGIAKQNAKSPNGLPPPS